MSIQVVASDVTVDIAALVRGIQRAAPGDATIVDGLLVGEWPREADEPLTLFFVLVAEYAGGRVTLPRAISADIVRQLEEAGNEGTI
jgi:hypothetical protein